MCSGAEVKCEKTVSVLQSATCRASMMWRRIRRAFSERRSGKSSAVPPNSQNERDSFLQNSLRSLKTRSMILSDLDWRSKSVDIIHGLPSGQGAHVLSVQKLTNIGDIEETVKRQVRLRFQKNHWIYLRFDLSARVRHSPSHTEACQLMWRPLPQGTLNKADLVKAGKKVQKKNWVSCFLVLTSKNLFVYKDAQSGQQTTPGEGAQSRLALPGALIEWCPEKSKRKNCFQVSTVQGQKVLFQDDNVQTSKEWFESIKGCIIHLPLGYDISGEILKARTPQGRESAGATCSTTTRDFSVGKMIQLISVLSFLNSMRS